MSTAAIVRPLLAHRYIGGDTQCHQRGNLAGVVWAFCARGPLSQRLADRNPYVSPVKSSSEWAEWTTTKATTTPIPAKARRARCTNARPSSLSHYWHSKRCLRVEPRMTLLPCPAMLPASFQLSHPIASVCYALIDDYSPSTWLCHQLAC